jgi:hypothetical protein
MINTFKTFQKTYPLDGVTDYYYIWFFGDVHRFARSCDVDRWKYFLKKAKEDVDARPDRTLFVGLGDYDDFASTREKKDMSKLHETTIDGFDMIDERNMREMAKEMSFMRGRTIGLIEGNHHWVRSNGKTSTMDLCERLETEYLGWLCHYTMLFKPSYNMTTPVHMVLCHGKAGGKRAGTSINHVEDMKGIFPAADIYCMGHDHQRGAWPVNVLIPVPALPGYKLKQKRQFLCRSGSFKKAYEDNTAGYEISRLLKPADLGALRLKIGFHVNKKKESESRIVTDIEALI